VSVPSYMHPTKILKICQRVAGGRRRSGMTASCVVVSAPTRIRRRHLRPAAHSVSIALTLRPRRPPCRIALLAMRKQSTRPGTTNAPVNWTKVLQLGRFPIESADIGALDAHQFEDRVELKVTVYRQALARAIEANGLPLPDWRLALSDAFGDKLSESMRHLLYTSILYDSAISGMTLAEFLRWAETQSPDFDYYLAVPAVQEKIRAINSSRSAATKRKLAKIISGIADGRPRRLPPARILLVHVKAAEILLRPLRDLIASSENPAALWPEQKRLRPEAAARFEESGLYTRWFTELQRPRGQNRTLHYMACEYVAVTMHSTVDTILRKVGTVRQRPTGGFTAKDFAKIRL